VTVAWWSVIAVKGPARLGRLRKHLLEVVKLNRETWRYIRAETDDDHEWLPNPKQKGVIGLPVRDEMIDAWLEMMGELEALLDGKTTLPNRRWRRGWATVVFPRNCGFSQKSQSCRRPSMPSSRLAEQQIHHPATAHLLVRLTAMSEQVSIVATGLFEGVGEDRKAVESAVVVNGKGQPHDSGAVPEEPNRLPPKMTDAIRPSFGL
jgi:hypothetical protein